MKNAVVLALLISALGSVASAADPVKEETLGAVIAVKRTFTIDLAKCAATYVDFSTHGAYSAGGCDVEVMPKNNGEHDATGNTRYLSWNDNSGEPLPQKRIEVTALINGYRLTYLDDAGGLTDFATAKPAFAAFLAASVPGGQVTAYAHVFK